jgi:NAD(P)-dependent dehydrogenase (short-subunit alcohol dehydrogenase family)
VRTSQTVAVVTGASRGAGRGIAIALGSHGCTVYVTGRSKQAGDHPLPGTIYETAEAVTRAGGKGIAVACDHGSDEQTKALFEQVHGEQGKLDILVNNAAAVHDELNMPGPFWEKPLHLADMISVGVRSSYVATHHAMPLLIAAGKGLVVFTSASGSVHYSMGPAYGAHKAGIDKLAADMAVDFRHARAPVAAVSVWMGAVLTDRLRGIIDSDRAKFGQFLDSGETPEFTGHVIWGMFNDPNLAELSGKTVIGAEMAVQYGIEDEGGRRPPSFRDTHKVAPREQYKIEIR